MYAVIATGGKQYRVSEGDIVFVEKLDVPEGETYEFDQVLAVNDGEMTVGTPTVAGAKVKATVLAQTKGRKIVVYKYKRKTGYHKKQGHRQKLTKCRIDAIEKA